MSISCCGMPHPRLLPGVSQPSRTVLSSLNMISTILQSKLGGILNHRTLLARIGSLLAISRKPRTGLWVPAGADDSPVTRA